MVITVWAGRKTRVHHQRGSSPLFFIIKIVFGDTYMKELSVFVDESGDFGEYRNHSPYYIITMIFHEQEHSVESAVYKLDEEFRNMNIGGHCVHMGPLLRREEDYKYMGIKERQRILNKTMAFVRSVDIKHKSFFIEKKHIQSREDATDKLSKEIDSFIRENYQIFSAYDVIKIYYDNGQVEVNKIISSVFNNLLKNVEFRKVIPSEYKLFQVADLCCTFELLRIKLKYKDLSKSEQRFFGDKRNLQKNYLKHITKKEF